MNLTFDEAIENHRKMWHWIADETEKRNRIVEKYEYFEENNLDECRCECYCCEYAFHACKYVTEACLSCPIKWEKQSVFIRCHKDGTPYDKWKLCKDFEDWKSAAKYAREIANLPARDEVRQ